MKRFFISAALLSVLTFNINAEGLTQKNDTTRVVKLVTIKKAGTNDKAIDVATGKEIETPKAAEKKAAEPVTISKPTFPGGEKAIRDFVRRTMKYPKECEAEGIEGRVTITMVIATDGTPYEIKILRSSGNKFLDAEALRIAKLMPKWAPVKDEKNAEETKYMLPIVFRPAR